MSHNAISGHQFGEQLAMFMSPREIINTTHKTDASVPSLAWSQRQQWERPGSGNNSKRMPVKGDRKALQSRTLSLREEKNEELDNEAEYKDTDPKQMPPLRIRDNENQASSLFPKGKLLWDGHHRLAHGERHKMPWLPVTHE